MFSKKEKQIIKIDGMSCEHCAKKVESALSSIEGVVKVKVNLAEKEAIIKTTKKIEDVKIKEIIEELDYKVTEIKEG